MKNAKTIIAEGNIRGYILAYQLNDMRILNELAEDERTSLARTLNESEKGAIDREPEYEGADGGADWEKWAVNTIYRHYIINLNMMREEGNR